MNNLKQDFAQAIKIIVIAVVLSLSLGVVQAWVGPTEAPTGGNVEIPVNIMAANQIKSGSLWAGGLLSSAGGYFADNVGVGVTSPTQKLEVDGDTIVTGNITVSDVYITSIGKWASEIFPVYLVNDQHTVDQCSTIGTVYTSGGVKFCRIAGSSCPGSWTQYGSWNTTPASYCNLPHLPCPVSCTTGSHPFSNNGATYTCVYGWSYPGPYGTCYIAAYTYACSSTRSQVGCY